MILNWGGYAHEDNEVGFIIDRRTKYSQFRERIGLVSTWTIQGVKTATSVAALTTKLDALKTAYNDNQRDLIFKDNSGNDTTHKMLTADMFGGTKVLDFKWLSSPGRIWPMKTEYVNKRSFQIVVQGEERERTNLLAYHEELKAIGTGGPIDRWMPSVSGIPIRQTTQLVSTQVIVQEGFAVGDVTWPNPGTPLYPLFEHTDKRIVKFGSPDEIVEGDTAAYRVEWRYVFESTTQLGGRPFFPPV